MPHSKGARRRLLNQKDKEKEDDEEHASSFHVTIARQAVFEVVCKLKISLILPQIMENPNVLELRLKNTEYHDCINIVKEFRRKIKLEPANNEPNPIMSNMIDYFHENFGILEFLPNWMDGISEKEKMVLDFAETFANVAKGQLERHPMRALKREKLLIEFFNQNDKMKKQIKDIMIKNKNRRINQAWKFAAKNAVMQDMEDVWMELQYDNYIQVAKKIYDSNKEMAIMDANFIQKQKELREDYLIAKKKYEIDTVINLNKLKVVRDEKTKFTTHLQMLVDKYNEVMDDKKAEEAVFTKELHELQSGYLKFKVKYKRELDEYERFVGNWERQHLADLKKFIEHYAALRLQHWWQRVIRRQRKRRAQIMRAASRPARKGKQGTSATQMMQPKSKPKKK